MKPRTPKADAFLIAYGYYYMYHGHNGEHGQSRRMRARIDARNHMHDNMFTELRDALEVPEGYIGPYTKPLIGDPAAGL